MDFDVRRSLETRAPGPRAPGSRTARLRTVLLSGLLAAAAWPAAHAQQGVNLTAGPTDYTSWTLLGSAAANNFSSGGYNYSVLDLTSPGSGGQAGAAFAPNALALDFNQAFRFDFNWYITSSGGGGLRGDGMTFSLTTTPLLGRDGSDLGYGGLPASSLALAIDTFHFDGEPVSPSLQILTSGNASPVAHLETNLGDSIRNTEFQWFGRLEYDPSGSNDNTGTLRASIDNLNLGSFSVQTTIDFGPGGLDMADNLIYYGFTASNGAATDGHATSWGALAPVPEPGTWAMLLTGMAMLGAAARRQREPA